jgi:hypothetical protein
VWSGVGILRRNRASEAGIWPCVLAYLEVVDTKVGFKTESSSHNTQSRLLRQRHYHNNRNYHALRGLVRIGVAHYRVEAHGGGVGVQMDGAILNIFITTVERHGGSRGEKELQ